MISNFIYGVLFLIIAIILLIIFIINNKTYKNFDKLSGLSKIIALIVSIATIGLTITFSVFSIQNFTYRQPKVDENTKQLQKQISEVKQTTKKYIQKISSRDYLSGSIDDLYKSYSKDGQKDIDNLSKESTLTKDLFLRNVGRKFTNGGLFTIKFKATNGQDINFLDGKNRVILFIDNTEYSANVVKTMRDYIQSTKSDVQLVLFFPTNSGTEIDQFFADNNDKMGSEDDSIIISQDSLQNMPNLTVKYIAVQEYQLKNLPSYIAIDSNSVISNAGVGTLVNNSETAESWFNKSFISESKYYDRIVKESKNKDK